MSAEELGKRLLAETVEADLNEVSNRFEEHFLIYRAFLRVG